MIRSLLLCLLLACAAVRGADSVDGAALSLLNTAVRNAPELSEEERAPLLVRLQEARTALEAAERFRESAAEYEEALANGGAEIAELRAKTARAERRAPDIEQLVGPAPSLEDIEAKIGLLEAEQRTRLSRRSELIATMSESEAGRGDTQTRLAAVIEALENLQPGVPRDPEKLSAKVANALAQARLEALRAERTMLEARLRGANALSSLRNAREQYLEAAAARAAKQLTLLRDAAARQRVDRVEAEIATAQSRAAELAAARPGLASYAARNMALVEEQRGLTEKIQTTQEQVAALRSELIAVEDDAMLTRRRLEIAGLEAELGQVMLKRLTSLPEPRELAAAASARNALIAEISVASIRYGEEMRELDDRRQHIDESFPNYEDWSKEAKDALNELFRQRRDLLRENIRVQNNLLRLLVDSNAAAEALAAATRNYEEFLTGNLLWIVNYDYMNPARLLTQLSSLADPAGLPAVTRAAPSALRQPSTITIVLLLLAVLALRPRLRGAQEKYLGHPIRPREESGGLIVRGVLLHALLALPGPLLLLVLGRFLRESGVNSEQLAAIGDGLSWGAPLYFGIELLRQLSGRTGAGRRLLKWNSQKIEVLRRDLPWAAPLLIVAQCFTVAASDLSANDSGGSLGALSSLVLALTLLVVSVRALRSGAFAGDWLGRLLLQVTAVLAATISLMHFTGHLFAAHMYLHAIGRSVVAVLLALLVTNALKRMLLIYRANLERRAREESLGSEQEHDTQVEETENLEALASLSEAHTQLLGLARLAALALPLWFIWSPALPALRVLNDIGLWTVTDATLPEGQLRSVSVGTLLIAAIVIGATALVTKHLPPLVKVLLMEWGKVSVGARYATGMILQYIIIGIGASISLSMLGWEWSKVQWLVAALGVGIGFGLQEIVANFISGLILLFERPIRPGDLISVGTNDGSVTEINARATIIESFEGKELLIPNKDLITGTVINWSLSSPKLRVVIPVGIAYGSDVRAAMRILVEVARDNASVVADPAPVTTFEDFGDNALTLWLRCFAEEDYPRIWTELRIEINERFNAAGISIAFPQRDVHLDAQRPIPVTVIGGGTATDS